MNSLYTVIFVVAVASAENLCTPGSFFQMDCNMCTCSNDGKIIACTDKACPDKNKVTDSLELFQTEMLCKPGSTFNLDNCNTCNCNKDGTKAVCTMMVCPDKLEETKELKQICTPRAHFKDYCNTCTCADDGLSYACTKMMCAKEIWNKDGSLKIAHKAFKNEVGARICTPNSQFKEYCNACVCANDGLSKACTMMACDKSRWNKDGSVKFEIKNLPSESKKVCEASSIYSPDNCNICVCNEDGTDFACTLKICLPSLHKAYEDEETHKWGPVYKQGDICTPGRAFYSECNRCVCTNSGRNAFCTMMSCSH